MNCSNLFFVSTVAMVLLIASSCKKEDPISATPTISFVSISPNPAIKNADEIDILIEYTDGDGDLGENTSDKKNVFVTDERNNVTYEFRISQLSPTTGIIIKGKLNIHLPAQGFIDDTHSSETATYKIYVVDRAGNKSNEVTTPALTINL